jgi:hypothetical protein
MSGLSSERQAEYGDTVVLLVGNFDPPTNDHLRAVQALSAEPSIKHVWLAPLSGLGEDTDIGREKVDDPARDKRVRDMVTIFCADLVAATGIRATACMVGLDKKIQRRTELVEKCRAMFPYLKFKVATLPSALGNEDFMVALGRGPAFFSPLLGGFRGKTIRVEGFLPVGDVVGRIKAGKDESRSIMSSVWDYIQRRRLYR